MSRSFKSLDTQAVEIRKYYAPNWWSVSGVAAKMKQIIRKGIPNLKNWRFITLTIDPSLFDSELEAYEAGKDKMRRFIYALRQELGLDENAAWAWKLEFQQNGMPHWHLYFEFKSKVDCDLIERLWGFGRTNVKRCDEASIHYAFKYAFKPVMKSHRDHDHYTEFASEEVAIPLPDWFLDFYQPAKDGNKPKSLSRVRFWQTSKTFYTGEKSEQSEAAQPVSCTVPRSMREVAKEGVSKVQLLARAADGSYRKSAVVALTCTAAALFSEAGCLVYHGQAAPSYNQSYLVPSDFLTKKVKTTNNVTLCQIQQLNQQSIQRQIRAICLHQMRA